MAHLLQDSLRVWPEDYDAMNVCLREHALGGGGSPAGTGHEAGQLPGVGGRTRNGAGQPGPGNPGGIKAPAGPGAQRTAAGATARCLEV
ncbi:MAG: hypothetical protein ACLRNQ_06370 [Flavonifractor plautii]